MYPGYWGKLSSPNCPNQYPIKLRSFGAGRVNNLGIAKTGLVTINFYTKFELSVIGIVELILIVVIENPIMCMCIQSFDHESVAVAAFSSGYGYSGSKT